MDEKRGLVFKEERRRVLTINHPGIAAFAFFLLLLLLFLAFSFFKGITFYSIINYEDFDTLPVEQGKELLHQGYKHSNYEEIYTSTAATVSCTWKPSKEDDGYKVCEAIFEIEDKRTNKTVIDTPTITLDFEHADNIKNLEILYSTTYTVKEQEYTEQVVEEEQEVQDYEGTITGFAISGSNSNTQITKTQDSKNDKKSFYERSKAREERRNKNKEPPQKLEEEQEIITKREFKKFYTLSTTEKEITDEEENETENNTLTSTEEITDTTTNKSTNITITTNNTPTNNSTTTNNTESTEPIDEGNITEQDFEENDTEEILNEQNSEENNTEEDVEEEILNDENNDSESEKLSSPSQPGEKKVSIQEIDESEELSGEEIENEGTQEEPVEEEIEEEVVEEINEQDSSEEESPTENEEEPEDPAPITGQSIFTGWITKIFDKPIDTSEPFAVMVRFEMPAYEHNQFNFTLSDTQFEAKVDPDVSACGNLNSQNSIYTLNQSISANGTCFNIMAENITLDCQGNVITFGNNINQTYGVFSNASQTTVRNCEIQKLDTGNALGLGIYINGADNATIIQNTFDIVGDHVSAIKIANSKNSQVYLNSITTDSRYSYGVVAEDITNDSVIHSNTFDASGDYSITIYLDNASHLTVYNNSISTGNSDAHGIYATQGDRHNLTNNTITTLTADSYGVYLYENHHSNISHNTISVSQSDSYGVSIEGEQGQYNNVSYNTISASGTYSSGYYEGGGAKNNIIYNNTITATGNECYGFYIESSKGSNFTDNTLITHGDYGYAVLLYETHNNTFNGLNATTHGASACGLFLDDPSLDNAFHNTHVWTNDTQAYAVYLMYSEHSLNITDSILNASFPSEIDVYFDSAGSTEAPGTVIFTNVTYSEDNWSLQAEHQFSTHWYLTVNANSSISGVLNATNVTVLNKTNDTILSTTTDTNGILTNAALKSYQQTGKYNITYESNYTININYSNVTNQSEFNLTDNTNIIFFLNIQGEEPEEGEQGSSSSSSPSPGGGGGGGGADNNSCDAVWSCTAWSSCSNNTQTRTCTNTKPACSGGTPPVTSRACGKGIRDTLFDINLELLEDQVTPDSTELLARIYLLNIGVPGRVNATVRYDILNEQGQIIDTKQQVVAVETQTEFIERIDIKELPQGSYTLRADLTYEGQTEPANTQVRFSKGKSTDNGNTIIIIVILLLLGLGVLFLRHRKKKSKLLQDMEEDLDNIKHKDLKEKIKTYPGLKRKYKELVYEEKEKIYYKIARIFKLKRPKENTEKTRLFNDSPKGI